MVGECVETGASGRGNLVGEFVGTGVSTAFSVGFGVDTAAVCVGSVKDIVSECLILL